MFGYPDETLSLVFDILLDTLQNCVLMSIDLHRNGKTSFYTNLKKILDYYNISYNFNYENLDDMKIMHFVNHMQKKYINHWTDTPFAIHKSLNFIMFLKTAIHHRFILMLLEKILIEKHL